VRPRELGVFAEERGGSSDHLDDVRARLLRETLGHRAWLFPDRAPQLNLHQLACAERVVERPDKCRRDPLRANVHEWIEMVGLRA
jgi:hypothetical protein